MRLKLTDRQRNRLKSVKNPSKREELLYDYRYRFEKAMSRSSKNRKAKKKG